MTEEQRPAGAAAALGRGLTPAELASNELTGSAVPPAPGGGAR